ncbi:hypothetical protein SteCoe_10456 [Stentor coeruleus]|uniref:Protein kinase domain-containing protein n=1 Tax=Stentor coeruleus TaxID=5963 RepID=A0A1R2CFN0_9CILI|nr:hypothetical protein SteCoe_10456 [Stentor coeruleus]
MWKQLSDICESPTVEKIVKAFEHLFNGKVILEFPCLDLFILEIGRVGVEYIGKENKTESIEIQNAEIKIQEAHAIIKAIERFKLENNDFEYSLRTLRKKITEIESLISQPSLKTSQNVFEMDFSTIEDEAIIQIELSSVKKIDPPIYALKKTHFQVCLYKAIYNNCEVAVKMYQAVHPQADWNKIYKEIRIYQKLSSMASNQNCFLKYYGTYVDQNSINMVMEYYPDNLMKCLAHLQSVNYRFTEELIGPIFYRLLSSFKFMKDVGVFHSDIKPHNFLVDQFWNIKIIDFSISMIKNEDITTTATGQFPIQDTEGYIAPEIKEARLNKELNARFNPEKQMFSL